MQKKFNSEKKKSIVYKMEDQDDQYLSYKVEFDA
jgi:hypothetical protein